MCLSEGVLVDDVDVARVLPSHPVAGFCLWVLPSLPVAGFRNKEPRRLRLHAHTLAGNAKVLGRT
eukprot:6474943-Amphidinium_carterae.1